MKIRDLVEALRGRSSSDNSRAPKKTPEENELPPVEVADVVAAVDRSVSRTPTPVVTPGFFSPTSTTPHQVSPFQEEYGSEKIKGSAVSVEMEPESFDTPSSGSRPHIVLQLTDSDLADIEPLEEGAPPSSPSSSETPINLEIPASLPAPSITGPMSPTNSVSFETLRRSSGDWRFEEGALAREEKGRVAAVEAKEGDPSFSLSAGLDSFDGMQPERHYIKSPVTGPGLLTEELARGTLEKIIQFSASLAQATTSDYMLELLAETACQCLASSRAFIIHFDAQGHPLPIHQEFFNGVSETSIRDFPLGPEFSAKLIDHAGLFQNPVVVELAPGLSLLPAAQYAPVEWYLLPTGGADWKAVVCVQWQSGFHPAKMARLLATILTNCVKSALKQFDVMPEPEPEPAATAPAQEPPVRLVPPEVSEQTLLSLDEAILIVDPAGRIRFANVMAGFVAGYFNGELVQKTLSELGCDTQMVNYKLWAHLDRTLLEDQQFDGEIQTPDGGTMLVTISIISLPTFNEPAGQEVFSGARLIAIRDVTRSRTEATEAALQQGPTKPHSVSLSWNELRLFRSSLMMVLGFSELLHRGEYGPMSQQQFEMFRNIEHHAKNMVTILDTVTPPES